MVDRRLPYDGSGNITNIGPDTYVYDRLGRVASGTAGTGKQQSYTYDRYGNILTITTAATPAPIVRQLGVNTATNQASNSAPQYDLHGTYDAAGNVRTWSTGETFDYDGLGMVREATVEGAKKLYIYSASDERIATISMTNGIETDSMWTIRDTSGKVLRRLQKTGAGSAATWTWKQDYIYRGNQLLAAETDGPEHTLHFHPDHLGTPRLITGNGGAKVSLHDYYPFGEEATNPLQDTERLKFTGHERDTARLDYMHARYYSPGWGRFLSTDPKRSWELATPQSWNRYTYAANSPVNFVDPDGRDAVAAYDARRNVLRLQVNVVLIGPYATEGAAATIQSLAREYWGKQQSFMTTDGRSIGLRVDVNVSADPSRFTANDRPNTIAVDDRGKTGVTASNAGTLNVMDMSNALLPGQGDANGRSNRAVAAHEVGHLLGLGDRYDQATGQPRPGEAGSLMGDPYSPDARVTQEELNELGRRVMDSLPLP